MAISMTNTSPNPPPHRRRKRYAGTHPVRFDEKYKELQPDKYPETQQHVRAQGRTPAGTHVPIMVEEVLAALAPRPGEIVADLTLGYGGHAAEFIKRIFPGGRLVGLDLDRGQLERTGERLMGGMAACGHAEIEQPGPGRETDMTESGHEILLSRRGTNMAASGHATPGPVTLDLRPGNFAGLDRTLADLALDGCDVIFADLGVSSMQIDDPARGFSYKVDGPLDMRMDPLRRRTAADLLATLPEEELAAALADLGDEPDAAKIARLIVVRRTRRPIARTLELVELVLEAKGFGCHTVTRRSVSPGTVCDLPHTLPPNNRGPRCGTPSPVKAGRNKTFSGSHPAALTFQALRILVNNELSSLNQLLRIAPACLRPGGRIGILSFHSGEDRLVKQSFRDGRRGGVYDAGGEELLRPTAAEIRDNPRSSPARFRWAKKVTHA